MQQVAFAPLGSSFSAFGFGCASLGSRIGPGRGVAALDRAYAAGVTWFDVAPSYGDGQAEIVLGSFLVGKRHAVAICTKVGILPSSPSWTMRFFKPIVRRSIEVLPLLRKYVAKVRPPARRIELNGQLIAKSVTDSLRRLRTDYIDVLTLHEPSLEDIRRDDVLAAFDSVLAKGYARAIAVAGDFDIALASVRAFKSINIVQVTNNPFMPNVERARGMVPTDRAIGFVTQGVYGHNAAYDRLVALLSRRPDRLALVQDAGYCGKLKDIAAAVLLDYAIASNPSGIVLISMYTPRHLAFNLSRLTDAPAPDVVLDLVHRLECEASLTNYGN
jgi:aryl-alcohol dehydrogenase-like predicted oxidoreductase